MPRVKINLHGALKEQYDKDIYVHADTIREAITSLQLIDAFNPSKQKKRFVCDVTECNSMRDLDQPIEVSEININCEFVKEDKTLDGSGNNPYVNIIIGVVLVVVGYFTFGSTTSYGVAFISAGVGMIVGGIMQIINPVDKLQTEDNERNKSVTSYPNTVASGTPVPFILGKHKHGGHIFSLNTVSRSTKSVNLSGMVSELSEFEGSWVTMHSQLSEEHYNQIPSGGYPGGGGGGPWGNLKTK